MKSSMKKYLALFVFMSFLGACSDDPKSESKGCTADTECKGDRVCVSGVCQLPDGEQNNVNNVTDMGEDVLRPPNPDLGPGRDIGTFDMSADLGCPDGYVYNVVTGECFPPMCTDEAQCASGQYCDPDQMTCVDLDCTMAESACPADRPHLDPDTCLCTACLSAGDCGDQQVCERAQCLDLMCEVACDPNNAGACGSEQYCRQECCVDCIGSADCAVSEICSAGSCVDSPDCSETPEICPSDTMCIGSVCYAGSAPTCDEGCPTNTFCGADGICQPKTVDGCGGCNADCSCPNSLECKGSQAGPLCFGCETFNDSKACPMGQVCTDAVQGFTGEGICFPDNG